MSNQTNHFESKSTISNKCHHRWKRNNQDDETVLNSDAPNNIIPKEIKLKLTGGQEEIDTFQKNRKWHFTASLIN